MESTKRRYQQLVAVEILHHLFLDEGGKVYDGTQDLPAPRKAQKLKSYDVREWLQIEPDASTQKALQVNGLVLKLTKTGLALVSLLVDTLPETRKPLAKLEKVVLTFWLKWLNPAATNQTALSFKFKAGVENGFYVFGNQWSRIFGATYPHLTLPLPTYQTTEEYLPGDLVKKEGKHFLALAKNKGTPTTDTASWKPIDHKISYASRQSLRDREETMPRTAWGKIEITGKSGLSNYSLLTGTGDIKNAQVFKLHLGQM